MNDLVSNLGVRAAYFNSRMTLTEIARNCNWPARANKPDTARLERLLGLRPQTKTGKPQERIKEENAIKIAAAMGLDPRDVGV